MSDILRQNLYSQCKQVKYSCHKIYIRKRKLMKLMNLYDFIYPLCVDTYRFCSIAVRMNLRETFNILNDTVRYLGNEM